LNIDLDAVISFQSEVMDWWKENARDLPWRRDPSPYNVLVSEVMLQQTQVSRVTPKFLEFLKEFPTIKDLAQADTKRLLQVWSGLGYNRRAIWLRDAAQAIVDGGSFPRTAENLCKLKGIGPYTSRSILIFAFNTDLAAVDTNIRRVFIASGLATEDMTEKQLQKVADAVLLRGQSSDWHNALMDYGSEVLSSSTTGISPKSKQPKFAGSARQVRGQIIKILTESETITKGELISILGPELLKEIKIDELLNQLEEDRLVSITPSGEIRIAE
jgi:A/G-specific adenine glycosylase